MINKEDFIERVNAELDKLRSSDWVDLGNRHEEEILMGPALITNEEIKRRGLSLNDFKESMFDTCASGAVINIIDKNTPNEGVNEILSHYEFYHIVKNTELDAFDRVSSITIFKGSNSLDKPLYIGSYLLAGQKRNFNAIKLIDIEDFDMDLSECDEGFRFQGSGKLVISY